MCKKMRPMSWLGGLAQIPFKQIRVNIEHSI